MSTTGMKFYRENDLKLQFDSTAWSPTFIRKGFSTTAARSFSNTGNSEASIALDNPDQIVAISCAYMIARYGYSSGGGQNFVCSGPVGTAYAYYIFDNPANLTPLQSGETGVQFFDPATNKLTYCSKYDTFTLAGTINDQQTIYLPTGRTYAAVAPDLAGHNRSTDQVYRDGTAITYDEGNYTPSGNHNWTRRQDGKLSGISINDGTIVADFVSFDDVIGEAGVNKPSPDPVMTYWDISLVNAMILDVTGF